MKEQEISKLNTGLSQAGMPTGIVPEMDKQPAVVLETAQPEQGEFERAASDAPGLDEIVKRTQIFY